MPAINNECQSARYTRYVSTAIIVMIKVDEHHAYVGEFNMHPIATLLPPYPNETRIWRYDDPCRIECPLAGIQCNSHRL